MDNFFFLQKCQQFKWNGYFPWKTYQNLFKKYLRSIKEIKITKFYFKASSHKEILGPCGFIVKLYQTFKEITNSARG